MKREFVQLAQKYDPKKYRINGWYLSEKLDGTRAIWDGGISRGLFASEVPYANITKDDRYIRKPIATGLWSRYGKVIYPPQWFLNLLPPFPVDGELWLGRGKFQEGRSITSTLIPGPGWNDVKYMLFGTPSYKLWLADGVINSPNFKKNLIGCHDFVKSRGKQIEEYTKCNSGTLEFLDKEIVFSKHLQVITQFQLPFGTDDCNKLLNERLDHYVNSGGEGIILLNPVFSWVPERTHHCLKYKPFNDDEATVIGYTWGKETDKGSKLLGLMGNLIVSYKGKRLELSGFTDLERALIGNGDEGFLNPGKIVSDAWSSSYFSRGSIVTFRYRELSDEGIPKEARYLRKWSV